VSDIEAELAALDLEVVPTTGQIRSQAAKLVRNSRPDLDHRSSAEMKEAQHAMERASAAMNEADAALVNAVPTTLAGAQALLSYGAEMSSDGSANFPDELEDDYGTKRPYLHFVLRNAAAAMHQLAAG
jgi:hypothetical protein